MERARTLPAVTRNMARPSARLLIFATPGQVTERNNGLGHTHVASRAA